MKKKENTIETEGRGRIRVRQKEGACKVFHCLFIIAFAVMGSRSAPCIVFLYERRKMKGEENVLSLLLLQSDGGDG